MPLPIPLYAEVVSTIAPIVSVANAVVLHRRQGRPAEGPIDGQARARRRVTPAPDKVDAVDNDAAVFPGGIGRFVPDAGDRWPR